MTALVLVHGFMGGSAQWDLQRADLGIGFDVVPVALPGFGTRADEPALSTIDGFAEDVIARLDALGHRRFHLLGHSMGGMIVQQMVRKIPDRVARLVLYGTGAVGLLPGRFETVEESKRRARVDGVQATARRIAATWFAAGEHADAFDACARIAECTSPAAFDGGLDAMQGWSGERWLGDIAQQTLVIWGDGDRTYPWAQVQRLWQTIPRARLAVLPGCAHAVHMEKPDLFNRILLDFLSAAPGAPQGA